MSHQLRQNTCEVCGKAFMATRWDAKTCSGACRTKKSNGTKSGQGRGWFAVRPAYVKMAKVINKRASEETIKAIEAILINYGAGAAEWAIVAVYETYRAGENANN